MSEDRERYLRVMKYFPHKCCKPFNTCAICAWVEEKIYLHRTRDWARK